MIGWTTEEKCISVLINIFWVNLGFDKHSRRPRVEVMVDRQIGDVYMYYWHFL